MLRVVLHCVVACGLMSLPGQLLAGGPPLLNLPVDGVSAENMQASVEQLVAKLGRRVFEQEHQIKFSQQDKQWYLTFPMGADVRLEDVQRGLEGTKISVAKDRLHLFGHVILEIDGAATRQEAVVASLKGLPQVWVEDSKVEKDRLLVTLDMPYPTPRESNDHAVVSATFRRFNDNSKGAAKSDSTATVETLPSLEELKSVVAKHDAKLKDVRWSVNFSCRQLGGVAEPVRDAKETAER